MKKVRNELTILIGKNIASIRKSKHLSREDVEERSILNGEKTIKYRTLSLIEHGYGEPKITTLYMIAKALEVKLSDLINFEEYSNLNDKQAIINEIVNLLKTANTEKLEIILKQIQALIHTNF